jgi:hypothetical protein
VHQTVESASLQVGPMKDRSIGCQEDHLKFLIFEVFAIVAYVKWTTIVVSSFPWSTFSVYIGAHLKYMNAKSFRNPSLRRIKGVFAVQVSQEPKKFRSLY